MVFKITCFKCNIFLKCGPEAISVLPWLSTYRAWTVCSSLISRKKFEYSVHRKVNTTVFLIASTLEREVELIITDNLGQMVSKNHWYMK